ncbi:MAG: hypothetical protein KDB61_01085 [Planctomycetes bacterium]|nr:hypothetical protein [Planctomycetota bacterium]
MNRPNAFFLKIFVIFLPMAFIGTMLHEGGHIAVARVLGYGTTLHYDSMSWSGDSGWNPNADPMHDTWILLGGPLANMGIGCFGLFWLARLSKRKDAAFDGKRTLASVLALFWSRQLFNLGLALVEMYPYGDWGSSDEVRLARRFGLPDGSLLLVTAFLASLAVLRTITHVPKGLRVTFTIAGLLGSVLGFGVWYAYLGPELLP